MTSLFGRIWLSYWLVMALTAAAALAVSFALALKRADDTNRISPETLAQSAAGQLRKGGRDGLGLWVMDQHHTHPELQVYFVDDAGHEIFGRALSGHALSGPTGAVVPRIGEPGAKSYRVYVRRTRDVAFTAWQMVFQPGILLVLAITVSGLGSAALARQLAKPVERLRTGVRAIAGGAIETPMSPTISGRRDEVGGLARDIDQMTARLRAMIESKEHLLRDISHELRSPLARLRVATRLLRQDGATGNRTALERIDREVERLDGLIGQILEYSRVQASPPLNLENLDLLALLEDTAEDAQLEAEAEGKSVVLSTTTPARIRGDRSLVLSAIENVVRNAVRFTPVGQPVDIALVVVGGVARIRVRDAGPGIRAADLARICEPFFRADGTSGVGLGLSITDRITTLHGGQLAARNRAGGGLEVEIVFPVLDGAGAPLIADSPRTPEGAA
jgi:two-component system sensor histidine kinase CpxA